MLDRDVAVAGGGSAGIAAAVSAARAGSRVALIERMGFLGGMGSAALVHTICGLFRVRADGGAPTFANPGFPREFAGRLTAAGGAKGPVRMGRMDVLLHEPIRFAQLAEQMTGECPDLIVFTHSEMTGIVRDENGWTLELACRGERLRLRARALIDATGDATAATLAGHRTLREHRDRLQRPAYIVKLGGLPTDALTEPARLAMLHRLVRATQEGALPPEALGSGLRPGIHSTEAFLTIDLDGGGDDFDPVASRCLDEIARRGRALAGRMAAWMARTIDGWDSVRIVAYPARAGIRESRRLHGRLILEESSLLSGERFPDAVAQAAWPLEMRESTRGPRWSHFGEAGPGDIPLGCLVAADDDRLFAAGRCLSADHRALGSLRVMGTCMATGEAAGLAAALVARNGASAAADLTSLADSVKGIRDLIGRTPGPRE